MRLGILGYPVGHSLSPAMHRAALAARGIAGSYEPLATPPERLAERIEEVRRGFRGVNVTVPLKERVLSLLDAVDPAARAIGAVNTVVNEGGRLIGHNTDAPGFLKSLEEARVEGSRALVLGAGGAARAVVYALTRAGWDVAVWNRTRARAERLVAELGGRLASPEAAREVDLLVNATSVGLEDPAATPLPAEFFPARGYIVDLVYKPLKTRFLREAEERGLVAVNGLGMLLWQGAIAFELWSGEAAPISAMRSALDAAITGGDSRPSRE